MFRHTISYDNVTLRALSETETAGDVQDSGGGIVTRRQR